MITNLLQGLCHPFGQSVVSEWVAKIESSNVADGVFGREAGLGEAETFLPVGVVGLRPGTRRAREHRSEIRGGEVLHPDDWSAGTLWVVRFEI